MPVITPRTFARLLAHVLSLVLESLHEEKWQREGSEERGRTREICSAEEKREQDRYVLQRRGENKRDLFFRGWERTREICSQHTE